jgi:hypothetical protein
LQYAKAVKYGREEGENVEIILEDLRKDDIGLILASPS